MADNPCKMPANCPRTREEARKTAKLCMNETKKRCAKNGNATYCNYPAFSKFTGTRKTCRWLKRNPAISTTDDVLSTELKKHADKLIRKDPKFMEHFLSAAVCQHTNAFLDFRDIVYFLNKYGNDKKHQIYMPACNENYEYGEKDFSVLWDGKDEEGKGSLKFPTGFRKRLQHYSGCEWVAIFMTLQSDVTKEYHSNMLFYYPKTKKAERVEAAGYRFGYYDQREMDNRLTRAFKQWGIQFSPTIETLPRQGPAAVAGLEELVIEDDDNSQDPEGYCQTWSYFLLNQRYLNPGMSVSQLYDKIYKDVHRSNHTFLEAIRSFHGIVQKGTPPVLKKFGFKGKSDKNLDAFFYENYIEISTYFDVC